MAQLDMNNFAVDFTEDKSIRSGRKLRIGIIGTGGIANSHMQSYMKQSDVEIVAGPISSRIRQGNFLKNMRCRPGRLKAIKI